MKGQRPSFAVRFFKVMNQVKMRFCRELDEITDFSFSLAHNLL